jgi:hypothetical protein
VIRSRPPGEAASASEPSVDANTWDEGTVTSGLGKRCGQQLTASFPYRGKTHAIEACRLRDPVTGGVSDASDGAYRRGLCGCLAGRTAIALAGAAAARPGL